MIKNIFKKGFTLTELMAVVIIVAILAGIGMGSYKKAVERSHFTEGLVAGNTILEAAARYYYDNPDLSVSERLQPKVKYLDIDLSNAKTCQASSLTDYCIKTKYFEIVIQEGYVQVFRVQGKTGKDYYLKLYSEHLSRLYPVYANRRDDQCISVSLSGYDLCKSMGYTSCTGSGRSYTCKKA